MESHGVSGEQLCPLAALGLLICLRFGQIETFITMAVMSCSPAIQISSRGRAGRKHPQAASLAALSPICGEVVVAFVTLSPCAVTVSVVFSSYFCSDCC